MACVYPSVSNEIVAGFLLGILIKTIAMNTKTDFQIDHDNLRIIVERNYPAPLTKVWEAWTKPEYLDQ